MTEKQIQLLDIWFAAFPVWSLAFYISFFWIVAPVGSVSPLVPVGSPHYISWGMFWVFGASVVLLFTTFAGTCFLLQVRIPNKWRRLAWMMFALMVPPVGCPLAYFRTK